MNRQQLSETVERIVREDLGQRFTDEFVFDPILVEPTTTYWEEDPYIDIKIIFDGDQKLLDPGWTGGMIRRTMVKLEAEGIMEPPSYGFIEKSEWESEIRRQERYKRRRKRESR